MIDPTGKGVITRTQNVCRGSPKLFNISEEIITGFSDKTIESLSKLQEYQIPSGVTERLKQGMVFNEMKDGQIREVVDEFKKFIAILVINHEKGTRVEMVSELVDEVWHTFILFTNEYRKFCDTMVGEYIHHEPNVNSAYGIDPLFIYKKNLSAEFFYEEYEKYFGPLPELWKVKESSNIKSDSEPLKQAVTIVYIMSTILVPTLLVWQFYEDKVHALIEALILGAALVITSATSYQIIKDEIIRNVITKGSLLVGNIILILFTVFLFICGNEYAFLLLVWIVAGIVALIGEFMPKTATKNKGRRTGGGIMTFGCGSLDSDGGGSAGACCGGGGCGGDGGCGG